MPLKIVIRKKTAQPLSGCAVFAVNAILRLGLPGRSSYLSLYLSSLRHREREDGFEQIPVDLDLERAALKLGEALRDGEAKTVPFGVAGGIAAHETLKELVGGHVQGFAGSILKLENGPPALFLQIQVSSRSRQGVFADVVHQVVEDALHAAAVRHDAEGLLRNLSEKRETRVF